MLTPRELTMALLGAYHLARFDRAGMQYFDHTPEGALRSFQAALFVLPGYALLAILRVWPDFEDMSLPIFLIVEGLAFVINWAGFALAMYYMAHFLERGTQYPGFICAYNWSSVIQMAVYVPIALLTKAEMFPPAFGEGLVTLATIIILVYGWFIARTALALSSGTAIAVVLLDLIIGVFIGDIADSLL